MPVVLLAVVITVAVALKPPPEVRTVMAGSGVEQGIREVAVREYGIPDPEKVSCPRQIPVQVGHQLFCTISNKLGLERKVPVVVQTDRGDYMVGKPIAG
ncbi:DUF4333 domain-containing protein [Saccharopolyspora griseoalba]|uniref:DUF4333 domain-containing protein n=1 Tax=Saccharopolyspora griseoalba TaxID=1431848 RepID=A0ABW2LV79_9PSEU